MLVAGFWMLDAGCWIFIFFTFEILPTKHTEKREKHF